MSADAGAPVVARPRRRRWVRWLGIACALALALRIALGLAIPWLLDRGAREFGLTARIEGSALSVLGGMVELRGLSLAQRPPEGSPASGSPAGGEGAAPLASVALLRCDVDMSALLGGVLRLHRLDVDGLRVSLVREAGGRWHLPAAKLTTAASAPAASGDTPVLARAIDFRLPIAITSARVGGVRIALRDAGVQPPVETEIAFDAAVYDVGHAQRPARIECQVAAGSVLDAARLQALARFEHRGLSLTATVDVRGARLAAVSAYLRALGLRPNAQRCDGLVSASVRLAPRPDDEHGAAGDATFAARILCDDREGAALDELKVAIDHLDRASLRVRAIDVRGVRARAGRGGDGALRLPGLDVLVGAAAATPAPAAPTSGSPFPVAIAGVRLQAAAVEWRDESVAPPVELNAQVPDLAASEVVFGGAAPTGPTRCRAEIVVPEVVRSLELQGTWSPLGAATDLEARLHAEGLTLAGLRPYLAAAGVEPMLADGVLDLSASARVEARTDGVLLPAARLSEIRLRDGDREWLAVSGLDAAAVAVAGSGIDIGRVAVAGTRARVERAPDGAVHALGMRLLGAARGREPARPAAAAPAAPGGTRAAGTFALRELVWEIGPVLWHDATPAPGGAAPAEVRLDAASFTVAGLALAAEATSCRSARLRARSNAADAVALDAEIVPDAGAHALRCSLRADNLRPEVVARYLASAGLTATFPAATLVAGARARFASSGDATEVEGEIHDVELRTGAEVLFALPSVRLDRSRFAASGAELGALRCVGPQVGVVREADGSMVVAGWRLTAAAPATAPSAAAPPPAASAPYAIAGVDVRGAVLHWRDAQVTPPFASDLQLRVEVPAVRSGTPIAFAVEATLAPPPGVIQVRGNVNAAGGALQAEARVQIDGLEPARLQAYVPAHVRLDAAAHAFATEVRVAIGPAAAGGARVELAVPALSVRRSDATVPSFALRDAVFRAHRLDAGAAVYDIDEIAVHAIEGELGRSTDGMRLPGLTIGATTATPTPPPVGAPSRADAAAAPDAAPAGAATPRAPRVSLRRLHVDVQRLVWHDGTRAGVEPIVGRLRVDHTAPLVLLAPGDDAPAPAALRCAGAVQTLADDVAVDLQWTPSVREPRLQVEVHARGLHPTGLAALSGELGARIDGERSRVREVRGQLAVALRLPRGGLFAFDPRDGFGAEVELSRLALLDGPEGQVLAGVGSIRADVQRVVPATGAVRVQTLEVENVRGQVERTAAGWDIAGIAVRPPAATATAPPAAAPAAPATSSAAPSGEVSVDTLAVSGLDFVLRDSSVDPPCELPLTGLEVEVRGFSSHALAEPRDLSFYASLSGGRTRLPQRSHSSSVVAGVFGAVAKAVGGGEDRFATEERPVFDEIAVQGRLRLQPGIEGWARADVAALELPALACFVRESGVTIGDGVFDSSARVTFDGKGNTTVDSSSTFSYLSVSEAPGGPISTYLKLPAPLDTVLFALRNEDDEHRIPIAFAVGEAGLSGGQLGLAAAAAFGQLVTSAVAAAPLRAAGTITGLVGLTGEGADARAALPTFAIEFPAGHAGLPAAAATAMAGALSAQQDLEGSVLVLEHALGVDDLPRASAFANPEPRDALALAGGLRARARDLEQRRRVVAAQLVTATLLGLDAPDAMRELRALEVERATLDVALGNVLDLLRPGAERRADARARAAARALGEERLAAVRAAILAAGGAAAAERVELRRPKAVPPSPAAARGTVRLYVKPRA